MKVLFLLKYTGRCLLEERVLCGRRGRQGDSIIPAFCNDYNQTSLINEDGSNGFRRSWLPTMAPAMGRLETVNVSAPRWIWAPTYIVLKSCTHCFLQGIPKKMKELEFAHVMMVGTAANMAVYVLRDTEEEDQAMISDHLCAPEKYKTDGGVQTFYDHRKKWKSLKPWIRRIWSTLRRGRGSVKLNLTLWDNFLGHWATLCLSDLSSVRLPVLQFGCRKTGEISYRCVFIDASLDFLSFQESFQSSSQERFGDQARTFCDHVFIFIRVTI